jgi:hypothetical protein
MVNNGSKQQSTRIYIPKIQSLLLTRRERKQADIFSQGFHIIFNFFPGSYGFVRVQYMYIYNIYIYIKVLGPYNNTPSLSQLKSEPRWNFYGPTPLNPDV